MKIDVYSICWNEKVILPYFLKHYKQFARKITIYDNMSDDESVHIMENFDVDVIKVDTNGNYIGEDKLMDIKNNCWKNSDADWVIVCDIDEFVYHPNLLDYLNNTNYNHICCRGYEMMSETLPTTDGQIYDELKNGYPTDEFNSYNIYPYWKSNYSKCVLFKPSKVQEINYGPGAHYSNPIGEIVSNIQNFVNQNGVFFPVTLDEVKLLHYKYLSRDYVFNKSKTIKSCATYGQFGYDEVHKQYDAWLPFCKTII